MAVEITNVSISASSFAIGESGTITFTVKNTNSWTAKTIIAWLERWPNHSTFDRVDFLEAAITLAKNASKTYTLTFTVTDAIQGAFDYFGERAFIAELMVALVDGAGSNFDGGSVSTGSYLIDMRYVPSIPTFAVQRHPTPESSGAVLNIACSLAEGADPEYEGLALTLRWKEEDAASFPAENALSVTVADALAAGGTTVTPSFTFETGKAYTLRATFTDGVDSAASETKLSKAFKVINIHPTSKNIGLGQFAVADLDEDDVKRLDMTYRPYFHEGARDADGREIIGKTDYSTSAVDTGIKWTDGETIYRKVLTFTSMGTSATKDVSTGESAISEVVDVRGIFKPTGEATRAPIPWAHYSSAASQFQIVVYNLTSNPYVRLRTGSGQSCDSGFIVIEYTLPT